MPEPDPMRITPDRPSQARWAVPVVVVVAAIVIIAGGNSDGDGQSAAPAADRAVPVAAPAADEPGGEALFVLSLQSQGIAVDDRDAVVTAGRMVCDALDDDLNPATFGVSFAESSGLTLEQTGRVMGSAVVAFCPEHRQTLSDTFGT